MQAEIARTSADTDVRITPPWLWQLVRDFAGERRICDVCTEPTNPLNADAFYTEATNGIASRWAQTARDVFTWTFWCNPPYSAGHVIEWADKAVREARAYPLEILMLTQADVSTGWYRFIRDNADARCHLGRRVQFLEPDGIGGFRPCKGGAKFGSQIAYLGPRRRRFARIFGGHGEILHGLGPQEIEQ